MPHSTDNTSELHIGYKRALQGRIVVLEILGETNENRSGIANKRFAKMRCSKVRVLKIYDIEDEWITYSKAHSLFDHHFIYEVGQIIEPDYYDPDPNKVCSHGIHYYLSEHAARHFQYKRKTKIKRKTGYQVVYYDNGRLKEERTIGPKVRTIKRWDPNGTLRIWNQT